MNSSQTGPQTETRSSNLQDAGYWVTIPGGPFIIGDDMVRPDGTLSPAAPAHSVHVEAFQMGISPVSVREFTRFVEATGYKTTAEQNGSSWLWRGDPSVRIPGQDHLWFDVSGTSWSHPRGPDSDIKDKEDHPVTHVSLADCIAFCEWADCRLPNEAEWEKAVRGTDGRTYTWGEEPPHPSICNYNMNVGDTTPIGAYPKSAGPFGLNDGAGNVWEWTSSPWHKYPFGQNEARTITTRLGTFQLGVVRGGSFFNDFDDTGLRTSIRVYGHPDYTSYDVGFRVCKT